MALAVISGWVELVQSVDWSLTTSTHMTIETSERTATGTNNNVHDLYSHRRTRTDCDLLTFFLSFFLSLLLWPLLPTHCRCRGLLLHLITLNDTYTVGRTPLDEGSARRRDLYLATHNTHSRQTCTLPAGFEPAIPASERSQTHASDRAATGIGNLLTYTLKISKFLSPRPRPKITSNFQEK